MDLRVRKADLLRELQLFQGIVERKNTIPVLANVLMEASAEGLRLVATDLEVALISRCEATVASPGTLTIPAKKLYEIIRALPDTDIRIVEEKGSVRISADKFESKIQTLPKDDFPVIPSPTRKQMASLPREGLKQMVAKTHFAITGEDTRYFLNGAKFILSPGSLTLVATDGHRLAHVEVKAEVGVKSEIGVILPKKTLVELGRLLSEFDGELTFESGENHLFFELGSRTLVSRMIDGQFPAYERVIPKGNNKVLEFERDRLASAIKRVALLSNERSRAVKFEVIEGSVEITSSSSELGEAKEQLAVDYTGSPITISFNAHYVLDFLNVVETEVVSLSLKDEVSQALMCPVSAEGYNYTYVIMPMRT
jgi:DNA polymerase-3 subunit beta